MTRPEKNDARRAWRWLADGGSLLRRDVGLWLSMALLYTLVAAIFSFIPFIGMLFLLLATPVVFAGALRAAHTSHELNQMSPAEYAARVLDPRPPEPFRLADLPRHLWQSLERALRQFASAFDSEEKTLALMVISTFIVGAVVVIQILAKMLRVGGPAITSWLQGSVSAAIGVPAVIGLLVVVILYIMVFMAMVYAVPLVMFKNTQVLTAMGTSLAICLQHKLPISLFILPFVLILGVTMSLYAALPFPWDILAFVLIGIFSLPWFVVGLHMSFVDLLDTRRRIA